jgi:hypothetical protein
MITTMNTVNQTFNWSRFVATLRKEVVENKRGLLFTVICIWGLLTLIMILGNLLTHYPEAIQMAMDEKVPQGFVGSILTLVVCVAASMGFNNLKTKTSRASYLTSPSSTLEKFLVNILIYIVGLVVAFFACAQLADLTRIAVLGLFKSDTFMVPGPMNFLTCVTDMASLYGQGQVGMGQFGAIMTLGLVANAGLYLLGSVIWPRLSLLKTFAAIYAVEICLFILALPIFFIFGDTQALTQWFYDYMTGGRFSIAMLIFICVQIVVYFGLAWYLFKRKDVISLKWWK